MAVKRSPTKRDLGQREYSAQTRARPSNRAALWTNQLGLFSSGYQPRYRRATDVPPWGHPDRERRLQNLVVMPGLEPVQGAILAITQKVQSTGWYIEGAKGIATNVHHMLHNADFGNGWETLVAKTIFSFLTHDNGCFIEILGEGDPAGELKQALGIASLDSMRCTRTGDPEYPVLYTAPDGKRHKLHWSRVWFQADQPSPREEMYGYGYCALSRCVASAQAMIHWSEMRNEFIDDFPASGVLVTKGFSKEQWDEQMKVYEAGRAAKAQEFYRGLITLFAVNPPVDPAVDLVPFRQLWEGFQEKSMYDIIIDLVAMAFGIDRQEIAPLATSALGSGAQSTVLNQKSRGKGVGFILTMLERFINSVIPADVTFRFDFADDEQDMYQAQIRHMKATTILSLYNAASKPGSLQFDAMPVERPSYTTEPMEGGLLSRAEARYMLAKEGIIPRELLADDEPMSPQWEQFDDITQKARRVIERRYGQRVAIEKSGKVSVPETWEQQRKRLARGVEWMVGV